MKKRFARPLAGLLAFSVCLGNLALPVFAEGPELPSDEAPADYSLTVYIENTEDTDVPSAVDTTSSTETISLTDPETGDVTATTTTQTQWSGTNEDGLDVEGQGTRTETVTTGTETTDGPQPGQTTTTTTTETEWSETSEETGSGETDIPNAGTTIETETKTEETGSESKIDSVTTDAQDRVVAESGSYEGSETTKTETTDERTHTETVSAETKVEEGKPTVKEQEEHIYKDEESVTPSPSAPPEYLDINGSDYAGTEVTLHPEDKDVTATIPVDTSKYEPVVEEGEVPGTDADGNEYVQETVKTTGEDGKTITGYTVTTTYPEKPGETVTETVVYDRDADGNFTGYTSTTVVSKPHLDKTETSSQVTDHTGPITVEDADQPEPQAPEEVTIILVPEKPAESETTDAAGNTTKVTVENLYDTDGKTVIGYQVKTTVTGADGKQVSAASKSVWGTRTTVTTTTVTNYTTTETTTEKVTTVKTEQFMQGVTESQVEIYATPGELKASMGAVEGSVVADYATLATLLPQLINDKSGTTDTKTDLYNRPDAKDDKGNPYTYNENGSYFQWLGEDGIESAFRVYTPAYTPTKPGETGGEEKTWQAHQFVLEGPKDENGNSSRYYVYCTDFEISPKPNANYDVVRMEESGYYADGDEEHIRAIALNGYWGTADGEDLDDPNAGSLEAFKKMLREADIKDEKGNPVDIDSITPGMAVTATQAAIWYYGNSGDQKLDDKYITGKYYDGSNFRDATGTEARTINAIYCYLIGLEEEATTDNTLISEDDFAQEVKIKLNGKVNTDAQNTSASSPEPDKYDVDLTFTMALNVVPSGLDGSLVVQVVQVDGNGNVIGVLGSGKLNGENDENSKLKYNGDNTYTFSGLELASGAKLELKLDGTQNLQEGVYLFRASGGYKDSQTFIGVGDVEQDVHLNVGLEFNVTDPIAAQYTSTTTYNQLYETTTTTEFDRKTTVTVKSAEITVTEKTTDELHREWEGEYHRTYTYEEPDKPDKPDKPEKPENPDKPVIPVVPGTPAGIEEISVPAAASQETLPQTGQNWALTGLLGALGALLVSAGLLSEKRRKNENEA